MGLWAHRLSDLGGRTGVGRYAVELSRALGDLRRDGGPAYTLLGGREREPVAPDLQGLPVGRSWPPRRALHLAWMALGWPRFEQVGPAVDLVHVLFPSFPLATRARLVGTVHDLFTLDHPDWYEGIERRSVPQATRVLAAEADRIICVSGWVAEQVEARLDVAPERVCVVHSGISEQWRQPAWDSATRRQRNRFAAPYVVAVGTVTTRKNLPVVLRALARIETVHLVLAGPSGDAATVAAGLVDELGIADRVHVTGRLPDRGLVELVQGAEALVHPSLDEGFGFPPLEAMAAGTPALVARSGSLPEVVGDGAVLLAPDDADAWAEAIAGLVADPDHREDLARRGLQRAVDFTWARTAEQTAAVHRAVLEATQ